MLIHARYSHFNSIKVQLKPSDDRRIELSVIHFNSIKVQLKR